MLEALYGLSDEELHAMILRFFHNMSFEVIGEELDVSGATAMRVVARATMSLGRTMKKQE